MGLDADPVVLKKLANKGLRVDYGDAEDTELWSRLPLDKIKGILLTLPEFKVRCSTVIQLRRNGFKGNIGTICFYPEEKKELERLGVNFNIQPLDEAGYQLAKLITD